MSDPGTPHDASPGPLGREAPGPASARRGKRRTRLLVVDDEPVMGAVMRRIFGRSHDVTVVHGGREALALFEAGAEPDVVLCDVEMPDLDGVGLYEAARARDPKIAARFVFVTGGALAETRRAFLESVPNPVLPKPFELDALREVVRRMLLFRA